MIHLMNSAMMPTDGVYVRRSITREEFLQRVIDAAGIGRLVSHIGYRQNAELIEEWTGVHIEVSREKTDFTAGDFALCMLLKYRANPAQKGQSVSEDDFEFAHVSFDA